MAITKEQLATALAPIRGVSLTVGVDTHGPLTLPLDKVLLGEPEVRGGLRQWAEVSLDEILVQFGNASALTYDALMKVNDDPTPDAKGWKQHFDDWKAKGLI